MWGLAAIKVIVILFFHFHLPYTIKKIIFGLFISGQFIKISSKFSTFDTKNSINWKMANAKIILKINLP